MTTVREYVLLVHQRATAQRSCMRRPRIQIHHDTTIACIIIMSRMYMYQGKRVRAPSQRYSTNKQKNKKSRTYIAHRRVCQIKCLSNMTRRRGFIAYKTPHNWRGNTERADLYNITLTWRQKTDEESFNSRRHHSPARSIQPV